LLLLLLLLLPPPPALPPAAPLPLPLAASTAALVDADLLSTRPKADFPLGARLLIQRAFAFSTEFRENNPAEINCLAQTIKTLALLHRHGGAVERGDGGVPAAVDLAHVGDV
jgi:hypothetical protein